MRSTWRKWKALACLISLTGSLVFGLAFSDESGVSLEEEIGEIESSETFVPEAITPTAAFEDHYIPPEHTEKPAVHEAEAAAPQVEEQAAPVAEPVREPEEEPAPVAVPEKASEEETAEATDGKDEEFEEIPADEPEASSSGETEPEPEEKSGEAVPEAEKESAGSTEERKEEPAAEQRYEAAPTEKAEREARPAAKQEEAEIAPEVTEEAEIEIELDEAEEEIEETLIEIIQTGSKVVYVYCVRNTMMTEGTPIVLTSRLEGFEGCEVHYQWMCDKHDGHGFQPVPNATGDTYTFGANVESLSWNWKLEVSYR